MKIYLDTNVYEAALNRIRWLYDEFEHVIVDFSGGKDSTVMVNLALQVAEEKGRLPIEVLFIDQEAEWAAVIDYARHVMDDPRVKPYWLQVPIRLFNATSTAEPWLYCWEPGQPWIRDKEPDSYHENVYGTDRFKPMFPAFTLHRFAAVGVKYVYRVGFVQQMGGCEFCQHIGCARRTAHADDREDARLFGGLVHFENVQRDVHVVAHIHIVDL